MSKCKFILLIWLFLTLINVGKGADSVNYVVVKELQDEWLIYDKNYKTFFPLLEEGKEKKIVSASLLIDLFRYKDYQLEFKANPGLAVFLEKELIYEANSETSGLIRLPIAQLPVPIHHSKVTLSFYNYKGIETLEKIAIVKPVLFKINKSTNFGVIFPRLVNHLSTLYTLTFLVILGGIVIIKNRFSKRFSEFLGVSNLLPTMDENPLWDILSTPVLILIAINSFCVSLVLFVIKREYDLDSLDFLNIFNGQAVIGILLVAVVVFLIYILKYVQIRFIGWIFNLNEIVKIQFFELMKVSLKVNFLLTILILVFYSSGIFKVNFHFQYFVYFAIATLLIVLFRVGYLVFAQSGYRNIYLFSYLCATEILPLVIIIKLILF